METISVFDRPYYTEITTARIEFLKKWLPVQQRWCNFRSALDAGCGVGAFSHFLAELGLEVTAFDRRSENVAEAQRRHQNICFVQGDIEDPIIRELGPFDLVLCFGLLYHLENPFSAIRNLYALTAKMLIIESMTTPDSFPMASLVDEVCSEDQSANYIAYVPSQPGLAKMLYRAGFPYVYISNVLPDHDNFRETLHYHRKRSIMLATKTPLEISFLSLLSEPTSKDVWRKKRFARLERVYRLFGRS